METITAFDWHRLLIGDAPPLFLVEILFRTVIMLLWTGALLRWIGGRSISQLSIVEFLLVIALGSAVGDTMFYPEVPMVHAMLVILVVVLVDKGIDIMIRRFQRAKQLVDGQPVEVLRDGRILWDGLLAREIGSAELHEMLRLHRVENLGQLRLVYLEPSGTVSLFPARPPRPGLAIVPPPELSRPSRPSASEEPCCIRCGYVSTVLLPECPACAGTDWTGATPCEPL